MSSGTAWRAEKYTTYKAGARPKKSQLLDSKPRVIQVGPQVYHRKGTFATLPVLYRGASGRVLERHAPSPRVPSIRSAVRAMRTDEIVVTVEGRLAETPEHYEEEEYPKGAHRALGKRRLKASVLRTLERTPDNQNSMILALSDITGFKWDEIDTIWVREVR